MAPSPTLRSKTRETIMTCTVERSLPPWRSWCSITWNITDSWKRKTETSLSWNTRSTVPIPLLRGEHMHCSLSVCPSMITWADSCILLAFFYCRLNLNTLLWGYLVFFFLQGGFMVIYLVVRQRSCWQRRARTEVSWWEKVRVTREILCSPYGPETTRRTPATANPKSPTSWYAAR